MVQQSNASQGFSLPQPSPDGGGVMLPSANSQTGQSVAAPPQPPVPPHIQHQVAPIMQMPPTQEPTASPSFSSMSQPPVPASQPNLTQTVESLIPGASEPLAQAVVTDDDLDDDSLDKEWVHKAKTIVEQTQGDPFTESRELSKLRAEYLIRRYGRHMKVDDK